MYKLNVLDKLYPQQNIHILIYITQCSKLDKTKYAT